jgi:hypothetical protein
VVEQLSVAWYDQYHNPTTSLSPSDAHARTAVMNNKKPTPLVGNLFPRSMAFWEPVHEPDTAMYSIVSHNTRLCQNTSYQPLEPTSRWVARRLRGGRR